MIGQEEGHPSGKHMKRNRSYPQPSRMPEKCGCRKWKIMICLPRLTFFRQWHKELAVQSAEQMGHSNLAKTWLENVLSGHPSVSSTFGPNLDRQRALAGSPRPLSTTSIRLSWPSRSATSCSKIYEIDEMDFNLGRSNSAKVI